MGCGATKGTATADTPVTKNMSLENLLDAKVELQDFIAWFRKDTSRDTKAGRAMLKAVCGKDRTTKTIGELMVGFVEKALEEPFDEELARLAQVAKAADRDGDGIVTEEEMTKHYGTVTEIFDEETARLAQLAKAADLDGDGDVTAAELALKYGSGAQDAAQIAELEKRLSNEEHLTEQQRRLLQRQIVEAKSRKEAKEAAAAAVVASQNGGPPVADLSNEEKARLMLQKHDEALKHVEERQAAQKLDSESNMKQQLAARKAKRVAKQQDELSRLQHGTVTSEELPQMEKLLQAMTEEAMKDGILDEEEKAAIAAIKHAIEVMHSAAADGAVSAEEMLHIQLVQKKSVTLAAQVVSP